jgi:hypothetical protein
MLHRSPLKEISHRDLEQGGNTKEVASASLRREKLWILRMKKLLSLPCSLLLGMAAPLNLEESNHSMSHDSVLLTPNLHWMLQIRQVGIEWHDVVGNDIHRRLQALLQLEDVEHIMHTCQGWWQLQTVCHIP